jgi:hypothetical protein
MTESVHADPVLREMRDLLLRLLTDADGMRRAHREAEDAARVPAGSLIARELVAEVVEEVFAGDLRLEPNHEPPADRFIAAVRRRAWRYRSRNKRWTAVHIPLEVMTDDETPRAPEPPLDATDDAEVIPEEELLRELRARAAADDVMLRLLELNVKGVFRREARRQLGVPPDVYRKVRRRLTQLAKKVVAEWHARRTARFEMARVHVRKVSSNADAANVIDLMRESMERWRRTIATRSTYRRSA